MIKVELFNGFTEDQINHQIQVPIISSSFGGTVQVSGPTAYASAEINGSFLSGYYVELFGDLRYSGPSIAGTLNRITLFDRNGSKAYEITGLNAFPNDYLLATAGAEPRLNKSVSAYLASLGYTGPETPVGDLPSEADDVLTGTDGDDTVDLLGGNDIWSSTLGADTVRGGAGNDEIRFGADGSIGYGDAGRDKLFGGKGDDQLWGGAGRDVLKGGRGNDVMNGGAGRDKLLGGAGRDTASYTNATSSVSVDLKKGSVAGDARGDRHKSIESLTGGDFDDVLKGTKGQNTLSGGRGEDKLIGRGGKDVLEGGKGADVLNGGKGFDTASYSDAGAGITLDLSTGNHKGEAKGDVLRGIEAILGSAFEDMLIGSGKDETFEGGAGADTINGGGGTDTASYSTAASGVVVSLVKGEDFSPFTNEPRGDTLISIENLVGSAFNDRLLGDAGANHFDGGDGHDIVSYADAASGVTLDLNGSASTGEAAGDRFKSIEEFQGSNFNDTFLGDAGDNRFAGGKGSDTMTGGAGRDTFVFDQPGYFTRNDADVVTDFDVTEDVVEIRYPETLVRVEQVGDHTEIQAFASGYWPGQFTLLNTQASDIVIGENLIIL